MNGVELNQFVMVWNRKISVSFIIIHTVELNESCYLYSHYFFYTLSLNAQSIASLIYLLSLLAHKCDTPPVLANGQITFTNGNKPPYKFETVARYECNKGFSLIGETTRTCIRDDSDVIGMWTGNNPSCSRKYSKLLNS